MDSGSTRIGPRVLVAAVRRELNAIPTIESCSVKMSTPVLVSLEVWIRHGAREDDVRAAIEGRLGFGFWIDLGMADASYTIAAMHRSRKR